jgi:lysophospholipase L1-like esterase
LDNRFGVRAVTGLAALLAALLAPSAHASQPDCQTPAELTRLAHPLAQVGRKLARKQSVVIVAIGSSSTAGAGASSKSASYPSRLEAELRGRFPGHDIVVHNRGIGGEEIGDMLKRFGQAVVTAKPDLVLWQLGTNSVLRNRKAGESDAAIRDGISTIRATGADLVLIDPQFAPKVIDKPEAARMVALIATTAKDAGVGLFRRFAIMKHWQDVDKLAFATFVSPDGLHMNDWSYACLARGLGEAIAEAARRPAPVMSATAQPRVAP